PPAIVPRTPELEADIAVILGWIAGAQFSNPGSSDDDDDDDDDDASTTEMTGMTGTSSSESTTEGSDSGDSAFAPIQTIFTANCTVGSACHTLFPPNLTSGQAYDNIVDAPSVAGDT